MCIRDRDISHLSEYKQVLRAKERGDLIRLRHGVYAAPEALSLIHIWEEECFVDVSYPMVTFTKGEDDFEIVKCDHPSMEETFLYQEDVYKRQTQCFVMSEDSLNFVLQ